jgi:hypothetical protein
LGEQPAIPDPIHRLCFQQQLQQQQQQQQQGNTTFLTATEEWGGREGGRDTVY